MSLRSHCMVWASSNVIDMEQSHKQVSLKWGDCIDVMAKMKSNSIDSIVCDPPYGIAFMGNHWDAKREEDWHEQWARAAYRIMKPGAHLLAFGGTRTYHRLACGIEDAGFEIRDSIDWIYGQGFPKSQDVGMEIRTNQMLKDIPRTGTFDGWGTALKPAHEPIVCARKPLAAKTVAANVMQYGTGALNIDESRIAGNVVAERGESWANSGKGASRAWHGTSYVETKTAAERTSSLGRWPANIILSHSPECIQVGERVEPGVVINAFTDGMKPFGDGAGHPYQSTTGPQTLAAVYECSEGCPIAELDKQSGSVGNGWKRNYGEEDYQGRQYGGGTFGGGGYKGNSTYSDSGGASRFFKTFDAEPQHLDECVLVASENQCVEGCPIAELDSQSGTTKSTGGRNANISKTSTIYGGGKGLGQELTADAVRGDPGFGDVGGASRFFYTAKSSKRERNLGLDHLSDQESKRYGDRSQGPKPQQTPQGAIIAKNTHPTVKPITLMSYLIRLVTPPGGTVLDPFMGSGSTGVAAINGNFGFIGIEKSPEYKDIARGRIKHAIDQKHKV